MGYAADGRARLVAPEVQQRVYDGVGDGLGVVLVGGAAAGAWSLRGTSRRLEVALDLFEPAGPQLRAALDERLAAIAELLGAREAVVAGDGPFRRQRPRRPVSRP